MKHLITDLTTALAVEFVFYLKERNIAYNVEQDNNLSHFVIDCTDNQLKECMVWLEELYNDCVY